MRGPALQALRHTFDLDLGAVGNQDARKGRGASFDRGRARNSAAESDAREGARLGVHTQTRISGGSGGLRRLIKGRVEFSQPERVSAGITGRGGGAVYARKRGDLCADTDCVFAADSSGGFVPAWSGLHSAAQRYVSEASAEKQGK